MPEWTTVALLSWAAGLSMPVGAALALASSHWEGWLADEWSHGVMAFGGGALLGAVALVLVPEGAELLPLPAVVGCFLGGGLCFMLLDRALARHDSPASQVVAMLSDFLPEALALGSAFAIGGSTGTLLALFIALQNLPEGFSSLRELAGAGHFAPGRIVLLFLGLSLLGPGAALAGYHWLAAQPQVVGAIMLFAAAGILYVVFQDIAPQARLERHWAPPMGAVLGSLLGLLGHLLTGCAPASPPPLDPDRFGGPTALFRCAGEDSLAFTVRHGDGELALWPPGAGLAEFRVLQQQPSASGTRFRGDGVEFREHQGEATVELDGESFGPCPWDRHGSSWEDARLRGVELRAMGNEPGWILEIEEGGALRLEYAYGDSQLVAPAPAGRSSFVVEAGRRQLGVELIDEPCTDDAGFRFPLTVELRLDGQRWVGCGRRLGP